MRLRSSTTVLLLPAILCGVIGLQFSTKLLPVEAYYGVVVCLGVITAALATLAPTNNRAIAAVLFPIVTIASAFYVSTGFKVLPFGDTWGQLWYLRYWSSTGNLSVPTIQTQLISPLYAQWPGMQLTTMALADAGGLSSFASSILASWVFFVANVATSYVVIRHLLRSLVISPPATSAIALLFAFTSPFMAQSGLIPLFKYSYPAEALALATLFLLFGEVGGRVARTIATVLLFGALVVTYSYTPLVVLALVAATWAIHRYVPHLRPTARHVPLVLLIVVTAAWWAFYGTVVFRAVGESALALWNALGSLTLTPSIAAGLQGSHYGAPTPPAVKVLIVARDLTFIVLAGAGLLLAATYLRRVPRLAVVLISTGLVAIVSLGVESVSAQALPNFYAVSFLIPLLACLAALPFAVSRTIAWRIVAPAVAVTVVVTGSLVGFWAHNYAPRHIYDPSVAASVAGEHPAGWEHVTRFLIGSAAFDGRVLTDDGQVLLGGSPLASIDQIYVLGDRETVITPGDVVVAFRAFRVDSYVAQVQPDRVSATYSSDQMLGLASAYSLLYADGETNVYRVPGPP